MTSIHTYDPETDGAALPPLPICALLIAAWNLLDEAHDLPHPVRLCVSDTQLIELHYPGDRSSYRSITRWAARFGGVITSRLVDTSMGPRTYCTCEFSYHGLRVEAWALIPAEDTA